MQNLRTWGRQVIFDDAPPCGGSKRWSGVICEVPLPGIGLESGAGNHDLHHSHVPLLGRSFLPAIAIERSLTPPAH
jgi:hypothetical protein